MFEYERPVRFEDVDAAGIVFFARYFNICHEALEAFFAPVEGGYAAMVTKRDIGVPALKLEAEYHAPLRYGDVVIVAIEATQIGRTSTTLRYAFRKKADGTAVATIVHKVVCCILSEVKPIPVPADVRAVLEANLAISKES